MIRIGTAMTAILGCVMCCAGVNAMGQTDDASTSTPEPAAVTIENDVLKYVMDADGHNVQFIDKATGTDYCDTAAPALAYVKQAGQVHNVSTAVYEPGRLTLAFGEAVARAVLRVEIQPKYITFEVLSLDGEGIEELCFVDIQLTLKGMLEEPFACCALALNLKTNVPEIPGPNKRLRATCYARFGFQGAKAAIIGCPQEELRDVMKAVVSVAEDLPQSRIGGPWALDAAINRGSYLFDFGQVTEETVDDWIAFVKTLGLNQIDFHTGTSLRFGDCAPNPDLFPNGRASVKAVLDKLEAAGIAAGLHTYAFFIAKNTPYVTPVPDARLGKDATFTLAQDLAVEADTVPVVESTEAMSTTTGFFVRNSVTLQVDDELITYSGISKEPPYAFTACTRGACGTQVAPHAAGANVYHLKECFGLFTPDADSTLLTEIARNTADTFNECGFDMIYLDALDGEDILAGSANSWHYGSKFVFEIAKRLDKPALFEMSTFHHHLWYVRARMGAWDHPSRSHKRFIDVHAAANHAGRTMFLPMNLGWWAVKVWQDGPQAPQLEPTFPDDIEYLMCKSLANNMGISLMGVNPGNIGDIPAYQRLTPIFKQYEDLRHAGHFPESIKARLRVPGDEFTLEQRPDGAWQFRPVQYAKHKVCGLDGWSDLWTVTNPFGEQPVQLRIQALMGAAPYDAPDSVALEDFSAPGDLDDRQCAADVEAALDTAASQVAGWPSQAVFDTGGCYTATNSRPELTGAWSKIGRIFPSYRNLAGQRALGVWVHGDGQGEVLNIQLRSAHHTTSRGIGDHYVVVDFTGWRYFELIEMEGGRIADYAWPYSGNAYAIYRETVDYAQIENLSVWYNNLPPGKPATCYVSPVRALPLAPVKLVNPQVTIGGRTITFPTTIESGCYLEFRSTEDCKLYGPKGELLSEIIPDGAVPVLAPGATPVTFHCNPPETTRPRAYVTVITQGEPLVE